MVNGLLTLSLLRCGTTDVPVTATARLRPGQDSPSLYSHSLAPLLRCTPGGNCDQVAYNALENAVERRVGSGLRICQRSPNFHYGTFKSYRGLYYRVFQFEYLISRLLS